MMEALLLVASALLVLAVLALLLDTMARGERRREVRDARDARIRQAVEHYGGYDAMLKAAVRDERGVHVIKVPPASPIAPRPPHTFALPAPALEARRLAALWADGPKSLETPTSVMADGAVGELAEAIRLWDRARSLADETGRLRVDAEFAAAAQALSTTFSDAIDERARIAADDLETQRRFVESKHL